MWRARPRGCRRSSSCRRRPSRHGPLRSGSSWWDSVAAPAVAASRIARTRSNVPNGILTTPSTLARVASSSLRPSTAMATIGTAEPVLRRRSMTVAAETRPWSSMSTRTTSGRSSRTWLGTDRPSRITSMIRIADWSRMSSRTWLATSGTSSTRMTRRTWSGRRLGHDHAEVGLVDDLDAPLRRARRRRAGLSKRAGRPTSGPVGASAVANIHAASWGRPGSPADGEMAGVDRFAGASDFPTLVRTRWRRGRVADAASARWGTSGALASIVNASVTSGVAGAADRRSKSGRCSRPRVCAISRRVSSGSGHEVRPCDGTAQADLGTPRPGPRSGYVDKIAGARVVPGPEIRRDELRRPGGCV